MGISFFRRVAKSLDGGCLQRKILLEQTTTGDKTLLSRGGGLNKYKSLCPELEVPRKVERHEHLRLAIQEEAGS
jgi:hypothetical protein